MAGTKSAPREIMLDHSLLESGMKNRDPDFVRVSTPPRVITLSEHHFPSASDEPEDDEVRYFAPKAHDDDVRYFAAEDKKKGHRSNRPTTLNSQEMVINHR